MVNGDYKLLNCPCCNGYAHPRFENFGQTVWIQCDVCGLRTSRYDVSQDFDGKTGGEWACEVWNRRVL